MKSIASLLAFLAILAAFCGAVSAQNSTVVLAWGNNANNLLLLQNTSEVAKIPVVLPSDAFDDEEIVSISAGSNFAVAATKSGKVFAWGSNSVGQLGNGTGASSNAGPVRVTGLGPEYDEVVVQVATAPQTAVALTSSGFLWTWGSNTRGVLGNGTNKVALESHTATPVWALLPASAAGKPVSVSCGDSGFCAVLTDAHEVFTWGTNENGQLGFDTGNIAWVTIPAAINGSLLTSGVQIRSIATGSRHMLALTNQGRVLAWGSNSDNQLGTGVNGIIGSKKWPVYANFSGNVTQISAGEGHSLVLTSSHAIYGWGLCQNYQLGSGMTGDTLTQIQPIPFADQGFLWGNVTSIIGYDASTFAITDRGRFYGWGSGRNYILGNPLTADTYGPLKVNLTALPDESYFITQFTASSFATTAFAIASPGAFPPSGVSEPSSSPAVPPADQEPPPFFISPAPVRNPFSGGIPIPASSASHSHPIFAVAAFLMAMITIFTSNTAILAFVIS